MNTPPYPLDRYMRLVAQGDKLCTLTLDRMQQAAMLALYDNGPGALRDPQVEHALNTVVAQLKDQIWP